MIDMSHRRFKKGSKEAKQWGRQMARLRKKRKPPKRKKLYIRRKIRRVKRFIKHPIKTLHRYRRRYNKFKAKLHKERIPFESIATLSLIGTVGLSSLGIVPKGGGGGGGGTTLTLNINQVFEDSNKAWNVQYTTASNGNDTDSGTMDWGDKNIDQINSQPVGTYTIKHNYSSNGVYNAVLTLQDPLGNIVFADIQITVTDEGGGQNPLTFVINSTIEYQKKWWVTYTITSTIQNDTYGYNIDWGDGTKDNSPGPWPMGKSSLGHFYTSNGLYTVTLTITDIYNNQAQAQTQINVTDQGQQGNPYVVALPYNGQQYHANIVLNGTGFAPNSVVTVAFTLNGSPYGGPDYPTTDSTGAFNDYFFGYSGNYSATCTDTTGNKYVVNFTI